MKYMRRRKWSICHLINIVSPVALLCVMPNIYVIISHLVIVRIIPVLGKLVLHNSINTMPTLMSQRSQCISTLNIVILQLLIFWAEYLSVHSFIFITWLVCIFLTLFVFGAKRSRMNNHCWLEFYGLFCPRKDRICTTSRLVILFYPLCLWAKRSHRVIIVYSVFDYPILSIVLA